MSPSADVEGMCRSGTELGAHALLTVNANWRRHRPSWITIGILSASLVLLLTGTFVSVKVPSKFVVVSISGLPDTSAPHCWHWTCGLFGSESNGARDPLGT